MTVNFGMTWIFMKLGLEEIYNRLRTCLLDLTVRLVTLYRDFFQDLR